jgi:hypothetical protein
MLQMTNEAARNDWARQPLSVCLWWGLPVAIGASASFLHPSFRADAGLCAVLFLWMATGCLLNAMRCHRLHCYISGPVLLVGAIFAALTAAGVIQVSLRMFDNAVGATLILALLSLVPEIVWERYAR